MFRKPDFTALEVLSFATGGELFFAQFSETAELQGGIPAGINVRFLFLLDLAHQTMSCSLLVIRFL